MTDAIKVYLPGNTKSSNILHVLYKLTDSSYWKESINSIKLNENSLCSKDNPWEIIFAYKEGNKVTGKISKQYIEFVDQADNAYELNCYIHDTTDLHKGVILTFNSNGFLASIGKELVNFFSGEMFLAKKNGMYIEDLEDIEEIKIFYSSSIASFGQTHSLSHNYSFQNALNALKPLNAQEMLDMKKEGLWSDSDYDLIHVLDSKYSKNYFDMEQLNNELQHNTETTIKKLKV